MSKFAQTCKDSIELLLVLKGLSKELFLNQTDPSTVLENLSSISSNWREPNAAELHEAVRLFHSAVAKIENLSLQHFHNVSQSITSVS